MYRIAFVTYDKNKDLTPDDQLASNVLFRKGIEVVAVPWNEKNVEWEVFDAVIIRSCWDYYLHYDDFLSWLKYLLDKKVKVYNPAHLLIWNSDKSYLKEMEERGFLLPESHWISQGGETDLCAILKEKKWKQAVVKPVVSAGAYETWMIDKESCKAYQEKLDKLLASRSFVMQEYIEEIESTGELSLIFFNHQYSHSVVKHPGAKDFRVQSKFGGGVKPAQPGEEVIRTAQSIIDSFIPQKFLYARVDGVCVNDRFYLMELELIEPSLFLSFNAEAPQLFAEAVSSLLG